MRPASSESRFRASAAPRRTTPLHKVPATRASAPTTQAPTRIPIPGEKPKIRKMSPPTAAAWFRHWPREAPEPGLRSPSVLPPALYPLRRGIERAVFGGEHNSAPRERIDTADVARQPSDSGRPLTHPPLPRNALGPP